jgi:hypothetical protein
MKMDKIKIKDNPKEVSNDTSRVVHQGGEAPSFGPVRQPK